MNLVAVKFKVDGKSYYFDSDKLELEKDEYVLVETEKGVQLGKVSEIGISCDKLGLNKEIKKVIKKATKKDYDAYLKNLKDAEIILMETRKKIDQDEIPMRLVDAMFTFDKKQLIFNFVADERIDFRDLVKYLAAKYKTHIELHQIGVRDKAKEIGGIGQCGMPLCCKTFKSNMDGISINMAKNQSISLNPSKINGCCGRLLCCLSYEDETYTYYKKGLPTLGDKYTYNNIVCKVIEVDILKRKIKIENQENNILEEVYIDANNK